MADYYYVVPLVREGVKLKEGSIDADSLKLIHTNIMEDGKNKKRLVSKWNDKVNE